MASKGKPTNSMDHVLSNIGKEKFLHDYCESIYKMLGLAVDFVSAQNETMRIPKGVHCNAYCTLLRNTSEGQKACHMCDIANTEIAAQNRKPICYQCHAGLYEIIVPLFSRSGDYLGCLTSGQFSLIKAKNFSFRQISEIAGKYHLDASLLYSIYKKSQQISQTQVEGIIISLEIIGRYLLELRERLFFLEKIKTPGKIQKIAEYIRENYMKNLSISEVSKIFFVSPSYLSHEFKQKMNMSFSRYLNAFRISKAIELLQNRELTVREIAFSCGFGSVSQFNRVFFKETGQAPKKYATDKSGASRPVSMT